jgi:hypothetical protein
VLLPLDWLENEVELALDLLLLDEWPSELDDEVRLASVLDDELWDERLLLLDVKLSAVELDELLLDENPPLLELLDELLE